MKQLTIFRLGFFCFCLFWAGLILVPAQERLVAVKQPEHVRPVAGTGTPAPPLNRPYPFRVGETLTYDFKFTRFPLFGLLGQIEMSVVEPAALPESAAQLHGSKPQTSFQAKIESRGFFPSLLGLKIRDTFLATVDTQDLGNLYSRRDIDEAKRKRTQVSIFDREKSAVTLVETDLLKENPAPVTRQAESRPWTADLLSIWYVLRCVPLEEGRTVPLVVNEDGKIYTVDFVVQKSEKIKTDAGKFKARRIAIKAYEANFIRRKGEYYIWISEDAQRLPVRVKFKTDAGTAVGELVKVSGAKK